MVVGFSRAYFLEWYRPPPEWAGSDAHLPVSIADIGEQVPWEATKKKCLLWERRQLP